MRGITADPVEVTIVEMVICFREYAMFEEASRAERGRSGLLVGIEISRISQCSNFHIASYSTPKGVRIDEGTMKRLFLVATTLAISAVASPNYAAEDLPRKGEVKGKKAPVEKLTDGAVEVDAKSLDLKAAKNKDRQDEELSAEEKAIRTTGESYVAAYCAGDARAAAAHFTEDAEYVAPNGDVYRGRTEIEELLKSQFGTRPGCKLQLEIDSVRLISPGVAVEDGSISVGQDEDSADICTYTAILVKHGDQWLTASVRDRTVENPRQHREQLAELDWLIGDWIHEGDDAMVRFSCQPTDNGNFLVRNFTVHVEGQETMSGTQRIGWDAHAKKFRTWVFDSDGGFSEGSWHRDGETWTLKLNGVTEDGEVASSTSHYTILNSRSITFSSVDHEVNGVKLPDSEPVVIVRESPLPDSESSN